MYTDDKISKEIIYKGLCNGTIQIINNPNDYCIAAQIGDSWFYFTGNENDDMEVDDYLKIYTKEEITDMIYNAINDEPINGETEDDATEWLYYRSFLTEMENN